MKSKDLPSNSAAPIVIVGGGFAGVRLAQRLERTLAPSMEIVVVSSENHVVFTPMLPEVVGRTISPFDIVVPGREMTRRTRWLESRVTLIDQVQHQVHYENEDGTKGKLLYAQLVFACGSAADLDEIPGVAARGHALKSVIDAIELGNDLIACFERATVELDPVARQRLLSVAVIGGASAAWKSPATSRT